MRVINHLHFSILLLRYLYLPYYYSYSLTFAYVLNPCWYRSPPSRPIDSCQPLFQCSRCVVLNIICRRSHNISLLPFVLIFLLLMPVRNVGDVISFLFHNTTATIFVPSRSIAPNVILIFPDRHCWWCDYALCCTSYMVLFDHLIAAVISLLVLCWSHHHHWTVHLRDATFYALHDFWRWRNGATDYSVVSKLLSSPWCGTRTDRVLITGMLLNMGWRFRLVSYNPELIIYGCREVKGRKNSTRPSRLFPNLCSTAPRPEYEPCPTALNSRNFQQKNFVSNIYY